MKLPALCRQDLTTESNILPALCKIIGMSSLPSLQVGEWDIPLPSSECFVSYVDKKENPTAPGEVLIQQKTYEMSPEVFNKVN